VDEYTSRRICNAAGFVVLSIRICNPNKLSIGVYDAKNTTGFKILILSSAALQMRQYGELKTNITPQACNVDNPLQAAP